METFGYFILGPIVLIGGRWLYREHLRRRYYQAQADAWIRDRNAEADEADRIIREAEPRPD